MRHRSIAKRVNRSFSLVQHLGCLSLLFLGTHVWAQTPCEQAVAEAKPTPPSLESLTQGVMPSKDELDAVAVCWVDAKTVLADKKNYRLVDVRAPTQAARLRVPAAINLPLSEIGQSPFLADDARALVLIGDAADWPAVLRACTVHQQAGKRPIRVLRGGLRAWHRAGGALSGAIDQLDQPMLIDAETVQALIRLPAAMVLTASSASLPGVPTQHQIAVPGLDPEPILGRLQAQADASKITAIVVFADQAIDFAQWRDRLLGDGWPEPLFFRGSTQDFLVWLRQQARMIAQHGQSLETGCHWN